MKDSYKRLQKYTVHFSCLCPNDGEEIHYKAVIETGKMLMVEDIKKYLLSLKDAKMLQEDMTVLLAAKFEAEVVTFGRHQEVNIECNVY